jgi:nicotinamidase-related amidase
MADLVVEPDDYEVPKQGVSAFRCGSADPILRHRGVRSVPVTRCLTNGGVLVNAVDAATRGYEVTVVDDGCALTASMTRHWAHIRSAPWPRARRREQPG